jgi:hypothetical protein
MQLPRFGPLALVCTATLTLTFAVATAPATESAPPDFPDAVHVENGCYVSATAYLAKFSAAFPAEHALTLTVQPRNYGEPHTLALVSWQSRWWGRDEYGGVFEVGRAVGDGRLTESLRLAAETALGRRAARLAKSGRIAIAPATPANLSAARRAHEVATATALLPVRAEPFLVRSGDREIPFLFFRPAAGKIAVYEPVSGTATAETAMTDPAKVVAAVATRLGYRVDSVRPDLSGLRGALVATASAPLAGIGP